MPVSQYLLQIGLVRGRDIPVPPPVDEVVSHYTEDNTFKLLRSLSNELVNLPDFLKLNLGEVPQNLRELVKNLLSPIPDLNSFLTDGFESVIDKHLLQSADGPLYIQKLSDLCGQIVSDCTKSVGDPNSSESNSSNNS